MVEPVDPGNTVAGIRRIEDTDSDFEMYIYDGVEETSVPIPKDNFEALSAAFTEFLHFAGQRGDVDDAAILEPDNADTFVRWIDQHEISARRSGQRTLAGFDSPPGRAVADD
jgi:hypothetical protein